MVDHIRRFAHGTGSISVVLKRLNHQIQNGQENILIWSWCHKCKQVTFGCLLSFVLDSEQNLNVVLIALCRLGMMADLAVIIAIIATSSIKMYAKNKFSVDL